jgi:hypothetical protein
MQFRPKSSVIFLILCPFYVPVFLIRVQFFQSLAFREGSVFSDQRVQFFQSNLTNKLIQAELLTELSKLS